MQHSAIEGCLLQYWVLQNCVYASKGLMPHTGRLATAYVDGYNCTSEAELHKLISGHC